VGNPLNVLSFGAVGDGVTNDVPAFQNCIAAANTAKSLVYVPAGKYNLTASHPDLTFTDSLGMFGDGAPGATVLEFNKLTSCIVLNGTHKTLRGLYINNINVTKRTTTNGVVHIRNCAYGSFTDLDVNTGGEDSVCLLLEQAYDGSAEDAYLLAHVGTWYNVFSNITTNYVSGSFIGYGISFAVNPNCVNVVNPTGQAPGTYTGSVNHNVITGLNIEGKTRGLNLDRAYNNTFTGGQFLGSATQIYGRNASANVFLGTKLNQWGTAAFDLDSSCRGNYIIGPSLFNVTPQPWSLGTIGELPVLLTNGEGASEKGLRCQNVHAAGYFFRQDGAGAALQLGNGINTHWAWTHQFNDGVGSGASGTLLFGADTNLYRFNVGILGTDHKLATRSGLCVGNSTPSSATGSIVRKMQVFDDSGNSLGFVPIYNSL
jgi:hypothetical protein